ncbi:MAG: acyl carrier protein [Aquabacterium sp.]
MNNLKAELRQFIMDNFIMGAAVAPLGDADSFMERQILDSTGVLEVVTHLESRYAITIDDEEMVPENLDSLDLLAAFVLRKQGGSTSPTH